MTLWVETDNWGHAQFTERRKPGRQRDGKRVYRIGRFPIERALTPVLRRIEREEENLPGYDLQYTKLAKFIGEVRYRGLDDQQLPGKKSLHPKLIDNIMARAEQKAKRAEKEFNDRNIDTVKAKA
jgi:hypothetical protein